MEVHHHPHAGKKSFKEYFLEFLMIFLAVTLGFFAETIRENISENSKAKELAESLYDEIYADSVTMHSKIKLRLQKEEQMEYFRRYVADSNLTDLSEKFYPSFAWMTLLSTSSIFEPNDGILTQLRSSGALRYFKNPRLQNSISHITVVISNIKDRNTQEYHFIEEFIRSFAIKHFDFKWMDAYTQNAKLSVVQALLQVGYHSPVKPVIINLKDFSRGGAEGIAALYLIILRSTSQIHYQNYIETSHELLEVLRKEYGFRSE
jgi:hypothetical protein